MNETNHVVEVPEISEEEIRTKILHILHIYPIISPTMLQGGLGPSWRPQMWRPVFEEMLKEGIIVQVQESMMTPTERYNSYTKIHLPSVHVTFDE